MVLHILRALFILLMGAAGWFFIAGPARPQDEYNWLALSLTLSIGVLFVCIDILAPRQKVLIFSGTILGLIVGLIITYALSYVVFLVVDLFLPKIDPSAVAANAERQTLIRFIDLVIGILSCYLSISFILQTKDDFRFIIP